MVVKRIFDSIKITYPDVFTDERGFFSEVYCTTKDYYSFSQVLHSGSVKNTLRGLHFQWDCPRAKLMRVIKGEAFLVAVDIKKSSPTFGKWHGEICNEKEIKTIWAPAWFARGFCILSDYAEIEYLTDAVHNPDCATEILWNDPTLGIEWPISNPILSEKDKKAQTLNEWISKPISNIWESL